MARTVMLGPPPRRQLPPQQPLTHVERPDLFTSTIGRRATVSPVVPLGIVETPRIQRTSTARDLTITAFMEVAALRRAVAAQAPAPTLVVGAVRRRARVAAVRTVLAQAPEQPRLPDLRVLAQNVVTRKWQHLDVPLAGLTVRRTLSGPQGVGGKLAPALPDLVAAGFAPWSTRFIVEDDEGQVRGAGILMPPFAIDGDERSVDAAGVSAYAQRETFDSEYTTYGADPLDVVRMLWTHLLTKPGRAPLKVTLGKATSKVRIGGYAPASNTGLSGPQTAMDGSTSSDSVPAYSLSWWEAPKIGGEIDELARQVPFDYVEQPAWNAERTDVVDHIELGWPRLGRRRTDLRFAEGENIIDKIAARQRDGDLVTHVRVRGAGEGRLMILGEAIRTVPGQLPVVLDIQDSTITSTARAKSRAEAELRRRSVPLAIEKILVDARHPHAPWGSYDEGDDILVLVEIDWVGVVALWHRIISFDFTRDDEAVAIELAPSQTFRYGSED